MDPAVEFAVRTLVIITDGSCAGSIGRIDRYTTHMVYVVLEEDATRTVLPTPVTKLVNRMFIRRLKPSDERAAPFPELFHPLRESLVTLIAGYAGEADDFERELAAFMTDVRWCHYGGM
jgi:hypothetical protein